MITENLPTLKIHKLTKEQYERELANGNIDETALYLTPEEEIDWSVYATVEQMNGKADSTHSHTIDEVTDLQTTLDTMNEAISGALPLTGGTVTGNLSLNGETTTKYLNVDSCLDVAENTEMMGSLYVEGDVAFQSNLDVSGYIWAGGDLSTDKNLIVCGTSELQDDVTINENLTVEKGFQADSISASTEIFCEDGTVYTNNLSVYDSIRASKIVPHDDEYLSLYTPNGDAYIDIYDDDTMSINASEGINVEGPVSLGGGNIEFWDTTYFNKTPTEDTNPVRLKELNEAKTQLNQTISTLESKVGDGDAESLANAKSYTDTKTSGMATTTVVDNKISSHNTSATAHSDIRDLITALSTKVNNFLDVDDTTTDELSEVLELINNNKGTLESLTSNKVNVSDIVDNLTTASTTKVLSANQGVVLKGLIDSLQEAVDGKADFIHSHTITATATDDDVIVLTGTNGTNKVTFDAKHATSGVTAGTYKSVTVNAYGHVTGGTNPTSLSGYGITDAYTKTQVDSIANGKANSSHGNHVPTTQTANNKVFLRNDNTWATVTPANIGAAASSHTHSISDVTDLQSSLNAKQATITGAATTIASSNLLVNRALVSDVSGKVAVSAVTSTELGYLDGVTSNIQSQLQKLDDNKATTGHGIYYGTCDTAAATAEKFVALTDSTGFSLTTGAVVIVKFTAANSATSPKLNVNSTGAKSIMRYGTTAASTNDTTNGWIAGAVTIFVYDGTNWVRDYWNNSTYSNSALGQGYATCSTAEATTAKVGTLSNYSRSIGGIVSVKFTYAVPASATLNINSKGATSIYYRGAAITADVIKAGDVATFIYNGSQYHLISIDRWQNDIDSLQTAVDGKANSSHEHGNITNAGAIGTVSGKAVITTTNGVLTTGTVPLASGGTGATTAADALINLGITATAVELNKMDGVTATTTELNYVDGVTSNIQTQLDSKAESSHTHSNYASTVTTTGSGNVITSISQSGNTITATKGSTVGQSTTGTTYTIDDASVTAETGAEIFNDYSNNIATGQSSHAEGSITTASGNYAHAEGYYSTASGTASHAEGFSTSAVGLYSHAEGSAVEANGDYSHAEGKGTDAGGEGSHAEGSDTTAYGLSSHAEGGATEANGDYAHAEGTATEANGNYSHAEGNTTMASASSSHAEGSDTTAEGLSSHAEGHYTTAGGDYSHAEGYYTTASGKYSHAAGYNTIARNYQYVVGKYNASTTAPTSLTDTTTAAGLFIVGIGTSDSDRKNGFRVNPAGKVYGTGTFGTSGADYAEYFEWFDGNPNNEDRRGRFVTLEGDKIRYATINDDYILGVVSADPSVAGDIHSEDWHNRYLKDVFGSKIVEVVEVEETTNEDGKIIPAHTERRWVLNPDYDPDVQYISREERPEWAAIGMVGKLVVIDDGTCQVNGYCHPNTEGIATASKEKTNYRVMERLDDTHIRIFIR